MYIYTCIYIYRQSNPRNPPGYVTAVVYLLMRCSRLIIKNNDIYNRVIGNSTYVCLFIIVTQTTVVREVERHVTPLSNGGFRHQNSRVQNSNTWLPANYSTLYILHKCNKNIIVFMVPFNIYNFHKIHPSPFFHDYCTPLNSTFKLLLPSSIFMFSIKSQKRSKRNG